MEAQHKRIAEYLPDALVLLLVGRLLYGGAMFNPGEDARIYQCYAVAFWQGKAEASQILTGRCDFFVHPDKDLTFISQDGLLHTMQQWRLPSGLIHFVTAQSADQPYHSLPDEY